MRRSLLVFTLVVATSLPAYAARGGRGGGGGGDSAAADLDVSMVLPSAAPYAIFRSEVTVFNHGPQSANSTVLTVELPETATSPMVHVMGDVDAFDSRCLDWRLEVDGQVGHHPESRDADTFAYSVDGEVGATVGGSASFRAAANGYIASGDDTETANRNEGYHQLFPTAHKWMGLMDFVGPRSNVAGGALRLSARPHDRWKTYVNVYEFHRLEDSATQEAGRLGMEVDAGARFAIGQRTGLRFGYGVFAPVEEVSDRLFHFGELELRAELP